MGSEFRSSFFYPEEYSSVFLKKYWSIPARVLEYFKRSTGVLQ